MQNNDRLKHLPRAMLAPLAGFAVIAALLLGGAPAARAQGGPAAIQEAAGSSFNSSFNGSHTGWSAVYGPWKQGPAYYTTIGAEGNYSSIKHAGTYSNFVYTVRIKHLSPSMLQGLYIRADPTVRNDINWWSNGYHFVYGNDTWVYIGPNSAADWYGSTNGAVAPTDWNVLKVVAYQDQLSFYLNGSLVLYKQDASFSSGSVGIAMFRAESTTGDKLSVDWAKLQVIKY